MVDQETPAPTVKPTKRGRPKGSKVSAATKRKMKLAAKKRWGGKAKKLTKRQPENNARVALRKIVMKSDWLSGIIEARLDKMMKSLKEK